ncbi:MAG: hypothetical protein HC876_19840 [Chloroflexaceae bacterium]|nr:hypothetical protein [Chloroflexaceae bacterium]NJO07581.1 hypothetical protein [Chloroflexaceae bacterium]
MDTILIVIGIIFIVGLLVTLANPQPTPRPEVVFVKVVEPPKPQPAGWGCLPGLFIAVLIAGLLLAF